MAIEWSGGFKRYEKVTSNKHQRKIKDSGGSGVMIGPKANGLISN